MAGEKLVRIIQESAKKAANSADKTDFIRGEVVSVEPLQIKVDNKFILDESFLLLSMLCKKRVLDLTLFADAITDLVLDVVEGTKIIYFDCDGEEQESHVEVNRNIKVQLGEVVLWDDLQVGEKVRMLRVSSGQLYYVLEREKEDGTENIRRI